MRSNMFAFEVSFKKMQEYYSTMPNENEMLRPTFYRDFSEHAKIMDTDK